MNSICILLLLAFTLASADHHHHHYYQDKQCPAKQCEVKQCPAKQCEVKQCPTKQCHEKQCVPKKCHQEEDECEEQDECEYVPKKCHPEPYIPYCTSNLIITGLGCQCSPCTSKLTLYNNTFACATGVFMCNSTVPTYCCNVGYHPDFTTKTCVAN